MLSDQYPDRLSLCTFSTCLSTIKVCSKVPLGCFQHPIYRYCPNHTGDIVDMRGMVAMRIYLVAWMELESMMTWKFSVNPRTQNNNS